MKIDKDEAILYLKSKRKLKLKEYDYLGNKDLYIIYGKLNKIVNLINNNKKNIIAYYLDEKALNPRMGLYQYSDTNARIEYGAIIREGVIFNDSSIVLMGAIINKGARIGKDTMVDMGAVIGSNAIIGNRVHVGANAVISGVMEPKSSKPVIIEDDVFIGANATVLEGIKVGKGSIIGAGTIVTKDVPNNVVVVGNPGRIIKNREDVKQDLSLNMGLRK